MLIPWKWKEIHHYLQTHFPNVQNLFKLRLAISLHHFFGILTRQQYDLYSLYYTNSYNSITLIFWRYRKWSDLICSYFGAQPSVGKGLFFWGSRVTGTRCYMSFTLKNKCWRNIGFPFFPRHHHLLCFTGLVLTQLCHKSMNHLLIGSNHRWTIMGPF